MTPNIAVVSAFERALAEALFQPSGIGLTPGGTRSHRKHPRRRFGKRREHEPEEVARRAHRLTPSEPPAPSVVASAEKRKRLYMHAAARRRFDREQALFA